MKALDPNPNSRFMFGFPVCLENGSFEEKLAFVRKYLKERRLKLQVNVNKKEKVIELLSVDARYIDIEITNICNAACVFCPRDKLKDFGFMDDDIFYKAVDKIRSENIGKIMFTGRGEPLLHPKFMDFIRYIKEHTGLSLEIFTNGYALTPDVIDGLCDINDAILDLRINVSLHSLDYYTHSKLVGLDLRKIAKGVRHLMKQKHRIGYSLCFVKNKFNELEMTKLRKYFDRIGPQDKEIALIYNKGGHERKPDLFDDAFYVRCFEACGMNKIPERKLCEYTYGHLSYYLNYKGEFTLCHEDFEDKFKLGHILSHDFAGVDKKIEKLKKAGGTAQCKQCTMYLKDAFHGKDRDGAAVPKRRIVIHDEARLSSS